MSFAGFKDLKPPLSPVPKDPLGHPADASVPVPDYLDLAVKALGITKLDAGGPGWLPKVEVIVHGPPGGFPHIPSNEDPATATARYLASKISLVEPSAEVQT